MADLDNDNTNMSNDMLDQLKVTLRPVWEATLERIAEIDSISEYIEVNEIIDGVPTGETTSELNPAWHSRLAEEKTELQSRASFFSSIIYNLENGRYDTARDVIKNNSLSTSLQDSILFDQDRKNGILITADTREYMSYFCKEATYTLDVQDALDKDFYDFDWSHPGNSSILTSVNDEISKIKDLLSNPLNSENFIEKFASIEDAREASQSLVNAVISISHFGNRYWTELTYRRIQGPGYKFGSRGSSHYNFYLQGSDTSSNFSKSIQDSFNSRYGTNYVDSYAFYYDHMGNIKNMIDVYWDIFKIHLLQRFAGIYGSGSRELPELTLSKPNYIMPEFTKIGSSSPYYGHDIYMNDYGYGPIRHLYSSSERRKYITYNGNIEKYKQHYTDIINTLYSYETPYEVVGFNSSGEIKERKTLTFPYSDVYPLEKHKWFYYAWNHLNCTKNTFSRALQYSMHLLRRPFTEKNFISSTGTYSLNNTNKHVYYYAYDIYGETYNLLNAYKQTNSNEDHLKYIEKSLKLDFFNNYLLWAADYLVYMISHASKIDLDIFKLESLIYNECIDVRSK